MDTPNANNTISKRLKLPWRLEVRSPVHSRFELSRCFAHCLSTPNRQNMINHALLSVCSDMFSHRHRETRAPQKEPAFVFTLERGLSQHVLR